MSEAQPIVSEPLADVAPSQLHGRSASAGESRASEGEGSRAAQKVERTIETPSGAKVPGQADAPGLTDAERAMLAFEREWWNNAASKEALVKQRFGMTNTQYHQVLNKLIDSPAALAADPMLVKRLQRRRASRRRTV